MTIEEFADVITDGTGTGISFDSDSAGRLSRYAIGVIDGTDLGVAFGSASDVGAPMSAKSTNQSKYSSSSEASETSSNTNGA